MSLLPEGGRSLRSIFSIIVTTDVKWSSRMLYEVLRPSDEFRTKFAREEEERAC